MYSFPIRYLSSRFSFYSFNCIGMRTNLFTNLVSFELIISKSGLYEFIFFNKIYFKKNMQDDLINIRI